MTQPGLQAGRRGDAAGVGAAGRAVPKLFGIVELDSAGTVLYMRPEPDGSTFEAMPDCTGRNFYTEVAAFRNVAEFRSRIDDFSRGLQPAHSMDFTCDYEDGPVYVRVLLARMRERSQADETRSVLIHIRRAQ